MESPVRETCLQVQSEGESEVTNKRGKHIESGLFQIVFDRWMLSTVILTYLAIGAHMSYLDGLTSDAMLVFCCLFGGSDDYFPYEFVMAQIVLLYKWAVKMFCSDHHRYSGFTQCDF